MKKLMAAFLTVLMLLCTCSALADIPLVNISADYSGTRIALGDTGLTLTLPDGWAVVAAPAGASAAFSSAETALTAAVITDYDLAAIRAANEAMDGVTVTENYVNGVYYLLALSADKLQEAAYTQLSTGSILSLTFVFASAELSETSTLPLQIVSTLSGAAK